MLTYLALHPGFSVKAQLRGFFNNIPLQLRSNVYNSVIQVRSWKPLLSLHF